MGRSDKMRDGVRKEGTEGSSEVGTGGGMEGKREGDDIQI